MSVQTAMTLLGLDPAMPLHLLKAETVNAAFRSRVKAAHPDTAEAAPNGMPSINQMQSAKALLLNAIEGEQKACKLCGGSGKVRGALGARDCQSCGGTGDKVE